MRIQRSIHGILHRNLRSLSKVHSRHRIPGSNPYNALRSPRKLYQRGLHRCSNPRRESYSFHTFRSPDRYLHNRRIFHSRDKELYTRRRLTYSRDRAPHIQRRPIHRARISVHIRRSIRTVRTSSLRALRKCRIRGKIPRHNNSNSCSCHPSRK